MTCYVFDFIFEAKVEVRRTHDFCRNYLKTMNFHTWYLQEIVRFICWFLHFSFNYYFHTLFIWHYYDQQIFFYGLILVNFTSSDNLNSFTYFSNQLQFEIEFHFYLVNKMSGEVKLIVTILNQSLIRELSLKSHFFHFYLYHFF